MASSLIRGKYVICRAGNDADSSVIITDGAVFQRDGLIEEVGDYRTLKASHPTDEEIGGSNDIVFPGLVNAHHHGRGVTTFQMGTCDDSLERWLVAGWARRPWDHYLMNVYTAMQMIESGTTTVMYNHSLTPIATIGEDVDQVLRGLSDTGMRTAFSVSFREQNRVVYGDDQAFLSGLPADLAASLRSYLAAVALPTDDYFAFFESLHRRFEDDPGSTVSVLLSPANVHWVSDETLQRTKEVIFDVSDSLSFPLRAGYAASLRCMGSVIVPPCNDPSDPPPDTPDALPLPVGSESPVASVDPGIGAQPLAKTPLNPAGLTIDRVDARIAQAGFGDY